MKRIYLNNYVAEKIHSNIDYKNLWPSRFNVAIDLILRLSLKNKSRIARLYTGKLRKKEFLGDNYRDYLDTPYGLSLTERLLIVQVYSDSGYLDLKYREVCNFDQCEAYMFRYKFIKSGDLK